MNNLPKGSEIQGAVLLSGDCYRNDNDELIIPDGKYLGEIFNQMPFGRIDKRITGIGATTLELESDRNSIIVVPSQYLAFSKSEISERFQYVGGEISGKVNSTSLNDIEEYLNNDAFQSKKIICVADSLWKVMSLIDDNLDNWFIMLDEIDTFQEQSNFREKLEIAIDYYLLFESRNRCLVSATMKDFSNEQLNDEILLTISIDNPKQRSITVNYSENIYHVLIHELLKKSSNGSDKNEKIVVAYNSVKDSVTWIEFLPKYLKMESMLLCSKHSEPEAGKYFGELINGKLPAKINFMTSAYFAGIDIYDTFHLIYFSNIKKPHTLLSIDRINQIFGRSRIKPTNEEENVGVLSETLIHNADGSVKNELEQSKDELIELAIKQLKLADCIEVYYKDTDIDLADIRSFQRTMLKDNKYMSHSLIRFKNDNAIEISYFNIDSILESQSIRNEMYVTPKSVVEHLKNANFEVISVYSPFVPYEKMYPDLFKKQKKNKSINLVREQALDNILDDGDIHYLLSNSKGEEHKFYKMYCNLSSIVDIDFLDMKLKEIRKDGLHPITLKNFEKSVLFQSLADDFPFKKMIKSYFKIGDEIDKEKIPEYLNELYNDYQVAIPKKFNKQKAIEELKLFVEVKEKRDRLLGRRKLKIIGYNPKRIILKKGGFALIINGKILTEKFISETIY